MLKDTLAGPGAVPSNKTRTSSKEEAQTLRVTMLNLALNSGGGDDAVVRRAKAYEDYVLTGKVPQKFVPEVSSIKAHPGGPLPDYLGAPDAA